MKIAIIVPRLNVKGGAQRQAISLATELQKNGHIITLYTFTYSKENCFDNLLTCLKVVSLEDYLPNWQKARLASIQWPRFLVNLINENYAAEKLANLIDPDTDILNPHAQLSYKVAYYFKRGIKDIPAIWMMNDMLSKRWELWREKKFGFNSGFNFKPPYYWLMDLYDLKFIHSMDTIVVLDNQNKEWVKKYCGREAMVIRSGLDLESFLFVSRNPPAQKKATLLFTGIFFYHRRIEDALEAVKLLKDKDYNISLSIVGDYEIGDGKYYKQLSRLVNKLKIESQVHFLGKVTDKELQSYYRTNDIFLFPNHLQTWGLVVFEAMACGTPVIVSRSAGAHEVLTQGENALLVNPKSPQEIALAIQSLIDNPRLYRALSKNGRSFVENGISWSRYAKDMLEIFKKTSSNL